MTRNAFLAALRTTVTDRRYLLLPALVLVLTWLAYAPGLHGGFIFDDIANLVHDNNWRLTEWTRAQVARALSYGISSPSGRPLALLSFAANHYWFGPDPYWLKAGNLLLHMINTVLVWLLVQRLIGLAKPIANARILALWIAAAWALHPLQVSTVLYVVQRMEVGAATGTLLALYAYVRARSAPEGNFSRFNWLVVAALAFISGLLFKETTVLACGFAFLIEAFFLRFRNIDGSRSIGWMLFYILGAFAACLLIWTWLWPSPESYTTRNFDLWERLLTQGPVLVMYLGQILAPLPDSLRFYYDDFPVSSSLLNPVHTVAAWGVLAGLVAIAWACRRRWPLTSFGIAWFFVAHALTSSFIPLELAFEHRNYLAILGVLLAVLEPIHTLCRRIGPDIGKAVALTTLMALAFLTYVQALTWGNPATLALSLELRAPGSQRAAYALGNQMLEAANGDHDSPQWSMARKEWQHANNLPGDSVLPLTGLLLMDGQAGAPVPAETWNQLREKLSRHRLSGDQTNGLRVLVDCRIDQRCTLDDEQIVQTLLLMLEQNPRDLMLHMIYSNYAWNALNDRPLALRVQREAVALAPNDPGQRLTLAAYLIASGDTASRAEAVSLVDSMEHADRDGRLAEALAELRDLLVRTATSQVSDARGQ